jgi:hypothetical protein
MSITHILFKYSWLGFILVTYIKWRDYRKNSYQFIELDPKLKEGYKTLLRGYLIWMNIPWVIMGIGCTIGGVPSILNYFRPSDGNPYVLTFFLSIIFEFIIGSYWIFFNDGAVMLAQHPGLMDVRYFWIRKYIRNPLMIRIIWLLIILFNIIGFLWLWLIKIRLPDFR